MILARVSIRFLLMINSSVELKLILYPKLENKLDTVFFIIAFALNFRPDLIRMDERKVIPHCSVLTSQLPFSLSKKLE